MPRLPFGDLVVAASYFDRKFDYEADATDYEFNRSTAERLRSIYDFGGDPRGFAHEPRETRASRPSRRGCSPTTTPRAAGPGSGGVFYSKEAGHTTFDSFVRDYQDTPAFAYFAYLEYNVYNGSRSAPTETLVPRPLRHRARAARRLRRDRLRRHRELHDHRGRPLVRVRPHLQPAPGVAGGLHAAPSPTDATRRRHESTRRHRRQAEPDLPHRRRPHGLCDLVGGVPQRRRESRCGRTRSCRASSARTRSTNIEIGAKTEWLDNRLRFNIAAYSMDWDDFAVQIEDPQPGVFQLGYVNLPTRRDPGRRGRAHFRGQRRLADRRDARLQRRAGVRGDDADADRRRRRRLRAGGRGRRAPAADAGLERRRSASNGAPRGQLLNAQPFARLDLAYVGEVGHQPRGHSSRSSARPASAPRMPTRRATSASASRARPGAASLFVDNLWDERAEHVPEQPLGGAAPVDHPAAHLRAPVPLRLLTAGMDIGVPIRSFGKVDMEALGAAILAQDEAAWNENVQRQKDYEVHEQTRSIVLLFANVEDWPAIEVSEAAGLGPAVRGRRAGHARDHRQVLSAGRHDHPRDGGEAARGRAHRPAPRFAPVVRRRPPHPRADHHQSARALHDRRAARTSSRSARPTRSTTRRSTAS